ncbi:MAG: peptidoglycan-binding protein [Minisyncoccia bacterium]
MNIATNNVASKLFVAFVAAAMLFTLAAPSAKAATADELQAQITALMAQIAALQGATPAATSAACTFTRALNVGTSGADVKCLQDYLTPTYFTNAGGSTGTFGPVTAAAVSAWQAANGISPAAGYFGPVSQAKYSALMAATPTPGTDDSDDSDNTDNSSSDLSGEASLFNMEIDGAADDTIEEGAEDAELAVATFEFSDGDAMITRMDVSVNTAITGTDAWDVLDSVALFVDGDEVARVDASDKDEYTNEAAGTLRFSGLDIVAMEDEEVEVTIAATLQGSIDSADQGAFTVAVESMRFIDGTDVTSTETTGQDFDVTEAFTIENAGTDDELIVKTSTSDPDGTTFELEDNQRSDWYNVFTFDLDTDDSVNDIELTTVVVTVNTAATSTYAGLVDDAELVIDGTTISSVVVTGTATTAILTFDVDGDVTINSGDRVAAELMLKFKSLAAGDEGATVQGSVTSVQADLIVAEGADDLAAATQISGAATGDVHTLRTAGVNVEAGTVSAVVTNGDSAGDDYATYKIQLEVTAFNQDVYISTNNATSVAKAIEDATGVAVTGTTTVVLESTGDEVTGAFEITEGSTETITITVTFDAATAGAAARLNLNTLTFAASAAAATDALTSNDQTWTASPDTTYRTSVVTLVN